jgi:enoyl-CoA hydratase/3-hydroxyacyl-CoA dehydrogenase
MFVFKAAVVGAGRLGSEIAYAIADAGIPVLLKDVEERLVDQGLEKAQSLWQARVEAGKLDHGELQRRLALIQGTTSYDGFGEIDLVIEAVPERMDIKQAVFEELDEVTPGPAILASSTSSLSITEMGDVTGRPERVVGLHFLQPASATRLIEVIEGEYTGPETIQVAVSFAQAIRKTPIRCAEAPGFVVRRILDSAGSRDDEPPERFTLKALVESCLILEEGVAAAKDIELGMMAGAGIVPPPFAGADQTGLDEVLQRLERARSEWGESFEPPLILRRLVNQGRLGVKSGQGFFPYARPDEGWEERPVKLETRGDIAIAWLDRPPANSISPEVVQTLTELWRQVSQTDTTRVLIVASANPMLFCAGADIKAFTKMDADAGRALLDGMHGLLRDMERSRVVTIAAVNALAFGGGCELAMGCDIRIAAQSATFGQPEISLGIIPGFGGTQRLPGLVGTSKALEMNLTGEPISAEEAYELGLVNQLVPDHELFDTALAWARKLAGQAPIAVEQIKRVSGQADLDAGIEAEKAGFALAFGSEDAREGISAFVEKRQARFTGR